MHRAFDVGMQNKRLMLFADKLVASKQDLPRKTRPPELAPEPLGGHVPVFSSVLKR